MNRYIGQYGFAHSGLAQLRIPGIPWPVAINTGCEGWPDILMSHGHLESNMQRLKLSGVDEGLTVIVSTIITGADSPDKVMEAVHRLFPGFSCEVPEEPSFPVDRNLVLAASAVPLDEFLSAIHTQRILDTSLDAMSENLNEDSTIFHILRQAALAGKVAYPLPGESPLGGVITIEIEGTDLADWIEAATWHNGRDTIPRHVDDDFKMRGDGEAITWH
jgi:predicted RNA binding protein with dsRBD fold (UPF0201 family)